MKDFLNEIGINITIIVGGVLGGIIGRKKNKTMLEQIFSVFASAFIANYLAPLIVSIFNLEPSTLAGVGFIIGYLNKGALDFTIDVVKQKIEKKEM